MVEQVGSGISRMRDLMLENNLTPPEFNTEGIFTVTFRRPFDFNKWVDKWVDNLTDNRVNIIKAIHKNNKVSKRELEEIVGISATAIDNNLDTLKKLDLIERVGSAKGGHWKISYILP
jgi:ATP-dependent DNA helicase RecG